MLRSSTWTCRHGTPSSRRTFRAYFCPAKLRPGAWSRTRRGVGSSPSHPLRISYGRLGASAYCASKAGVVMFTKVLAMQLAEHRINVNCVAPGVIDANPQIPQRASRMNEEFRTALLQAIPWGRRGETKEVAEAVLYLCSPGAEYITGALLPVDGGSSTGWTHMPYS